jgi:hypothetical protein
MIAMRVCARAHTHVNICFTLEKNKVCVCLCVCVCEFVKCVWSEILLGRCFCMRTHSEVRVYTEVASLYIYMCVAEASWAEQAAAAAAWTMLVPAAVVAEIDSAVTQVLLSWYIYIYIYIYIYVKLASSIYIC